ncbi:energy transducer TonB [Chitinophaga deserti]|uniref:energy transducer TonB n=1 Tax=Chitinophaga deserti TaxID=2164099 RepID=UPI001E563D34|nr:energy transducer TonB [Chitinophaga deserti]
MPEAVYPGGPDSLRAFFIRHFRYPAEAIRESAGGNVTVSFYLDKKGSIHNMRVCSCPHDTGLEDEVLRVSRKMTLWEAPVFEGYEYASVVNMVVSIPCYVQSSAKQTDLPPDYFHVSWSTSSHIHSILLPRSKSHYCPSIISLDTPLEDSLVIAEDFEPMEIPKIPYSDIICCFPPEPRFPGGEDSLRAFLQQHMKYPEEALAHEKSGTVFVRFTISETGQTEDHKILSAPIGFGLEEEALRVVRLMPNWIPGTSKGKAEKTLYTLPIRFSMD